MTWHLDPDTAMTAFLLIAAAGALSFLASLRHQDGAISDYDESKTP
jgi:multisubunit Na+/H+ antiporter MnhB subunit